MLPAYNQSRRPDERKATENPMQNRKWSRRDLLKTSTGLAAGVLFA